MSTTNDTHEDDVVFRPKSNFQKDDCINQSASYACPNPSVQEAVFGHSNVRCCNDPKCMKRAAEVAKATGNIAF